MKPLKDRVCPEMSKATGMAENCKQEDCVFWQEYRDPETGSFNSCALIMGPPK
jgi:hypothetical protein